MERFEEFKKVILERARKAEACREQYGRAYKAEDFPQLMEVIRYNFWWAVNHNVIDGDLIDAYREEFAAGRIWHNEDVQDGFLLASDNSKVYAYDSSKVYAYDSSKVYAYDSSTVYAYDSSTVYAYDSSTVYAYDSSTVEAYDGSKVYAYDSSYISSYDVFECKLSGKALWRIARLNTVRYWDPEMKFEKVEETPQ